MWRRPTVSRADQGVSLGRLVLLAWAVSVALVVMGTVAVLSTVKWYLAFPEGAVLSEGEVPWRQEDVISRDSEHGAWNNTQEAAYWLDEQWDGRVQDAGRWDRLYNISTREGETIPRIIHQTWKDDVLPEKWRAEWQQCRQGMPDYEYMLWTDEASREFVAEHYPAFLPTFDGYKYPIQRADSIRYFVLHQFGGVYMDLDMGCRRRMDPLLQGDWEVILPVTKPVGISNDLVFSSKGSEFMRQTINHIASWDHDWILNYPTVMFSTGPMFLSAQYAAYARRYPGTRLARILPRSLYGKNVPAEDVPHAFFSHFYGSSWHDGDAGFISLLDHWGKAGLVVAVGLAAAVVLRLSLVKKHEHATALGYEALPSSGGVFWPSTGSARSSISAASSSEDLNNDPISRVSSPSISSTHPVGSAIRHLRLAFRWLNPAVLLSGPTVAESSATSPLLPSDRSRPSRRGRTASTAARLPKKLESDDLEKGPGRASPSSYEKRASPV